MLEVFESNDADIVSGWREKRVDNFLLRRLPSRVANWMMAKFSGVDIHDFGTTFKVYRRETIKDIRLYGELHRFIPALAAWNGAKVVEVPIRNIVRPGGHSHYGLSRTVRVFFDLLTIRFLLRYMMRPLHFSALQVSLPARPALRFCYSSSWKKRCTTSRSSSNTARCWFSA